MLVHAKNTFVMFSIVGTPDIFVSGTVAKDGLGVLFIAVCDRLGGESCRHQSR